MDKFSKSCANEGVKPILVVGLNRSGTKWLSNILCNHPDIAGVQSERARGILETNMFHRMQEKFDLRAADDYLGFVELWSKTELFKSSGEDRQFLYQLNPRPLSFIRIFDIVMERYAERRKASFWLQKCDPDRALEVIPVLNSPRIVIIGRETIAVGRSMQQMNRNRGARFSLLKSIPSIVRAEKLLAKISNRYSVIETTYESLKKDPSATISRICKQLGLTFSDSMLDVRYNPNTSFRDGLPEPLSPTYIATLRLVVGGSRALPVWVLSRILKMPWRHRIPLRFVSGTFGDRKNRLADQTDYYK